jgi:hypothetical protein
MLQIMKFTIWDNNQENCPQLYQEIKNDVISWFDMDGNPVEIPNAVAYYCIDPNPTIPSWYTGV